MCVFKTLNIEGAHTNLGYRFPLKLWVLSSVGAHFPMVKIG